MFIPLNLETNLCKGKEPSKVQLYAHIHCSKINGKSPIVAQIEEAIKDASRPEETNENGDGTGIREASTEDVCVDVPDLDINTIHFTNTDSQVVYVSCIIPTLSFHCFYF